MAVVAATSAAIGSAVSPVPSGAWASTETAHIRTVAPDKSASAGFAVGKEQNVITVLQIHKVAADQQARLVRQVKLANRMLRSDEDFVSASVLVETEPMPANGLTLADGKLNVAQYVQFRATPRAQERIGRLLVGVRRDAGITTIPRQYRIAYTSSRSGDSINTFKVGQGVVAMNEVTIKQRGTQEEVLDAMIANDAFVQANAERVGWRSTNTHLSLDGERNVNVIQYDAREPVVNAVVNELPKPGEAEARIGTSDVRVYEITDIVTR